MSDNINKKNDIWLIGAGYMATEYAKVLEGLKRSYTVIGKGRAHAEQFRKDTGHEVIEGGIQAYLAQNGIAAPAYAIVTANPDSLKEITLRLIELGVKEILVEKPAGLIWPRSPKSALPPQRRTHMSMSLTTGVSTLPCWQRKK
jgi:hypothetical protein